MPGLPSFAELAAAPDPPLDLIALALAAEFRDIDPVPVLATLDVLGEELGELAAATDGSPAAEAGVCTQLLGDEHGFAGDEDQYDRPDNSMLDLVLERRRGLPILLSVVYVEVARRADVDLRGIGLPGHFVVGHFGGAAPVVLDPFAGGAVIEPAVPAAALRSWSTHETALRMLNNLVPAFEKRGDLGAAIHAAELRLLLPAANELQDDLLSELRAVQARMN